jgi:hypothetical protein
MKGDHTRPLPTGQERKGLKVTLDMTFTMTPAFSSKSGVSQNRR